MTRSTVDPLTAMSGVGREELVEQRGAQLGHRGPDRELHRSQALGPTVAERACRQLGQPGYFGGELRLELGEEPLFSASGSLGWASAASGGTGLASQIASLTCTISPTITLKRL